MVMQNHSCDVHVASRVPFPGCALPRPFVNDRKCDCPDTCADEDRLTLTSLPGLKMWNKKEISIESFESFAKRKKQMKTNETINKFQLSHLSHLRNSRKKQMKQVWMFGRIVETCW